MELMQVKATYSSLLGGLYLSIELVFTNFAVVMELLLFRDLTSKSVICIVRYIAYLL